MFKAMELETPHGDELARATNIDWKYGFGKSRHCCLEKCELEADTLDTQKIVHLVEQQNGTILKELGGVSGIADLLRSNLSEGISDDSQEIDKRKKRFGSNRYPKQPPTSVCICVKIACKDILLILLLLYGLTALGFEIKIGGLHDGFSTLVATLTILLIDSSAIFAQKLHFSNLKVKTTNVKVEVMRGREMKQLCHFDVVVGDVVYLKMGDQIPADGLVINRHSLWIDQSSVTGESELIAVSPEEPFLLSGSKVCDGYGVMLVTGVGISTKWGQLMAALHNVDSGEEITLHSRVKKGVIFARKAGVCVAITGFVASFIHYFVAPMKGLRDLWSFKLPNTSSVHTFQTFLNIVGSVLALVVVVIPEGLPLAVSSSLVHAMQGMMANNALTRRLGACERIGHVTTICSDITGFLTLNKMLVMKACIAGGMRDLATNPQKIDPYLQAIRPEVHEAIRQFQAAGIKIRMITGEHIATAEAIATNCEILEGRSLAVEGSTFRKYTPEERSYYLPNLVVMARSSPEDELLMARMLKEEGEVVAVTAGEIDGGPALLHNADVRLKLGIQNTAVTNDNSDIIILDDNWASLVHTVRWGRALYGNIQKCLQFWLQSVLTACVVNCVAFVLTGNLSLTVAQLLWANLIVVRLGVLALAREPPSNDILDKPPVKINERLMPNILWCNLILQSFYQMVVLLVWQHKLEGAETDNVKRTVLFNFLVFCQLFNLVNARESEEMNIFGGIFTNRLLLGVVGITVVLQVMLVEFLGTSASIVKLSCKYWAMSVGFAFLSWPLGVVGKLLPVPKRLVLDASYHRELQLHPNVLGAPHAEP